LGIPSGNNVKNKQMKNQIFPFYKCCLLISCLFIQHFAVAQETKNDSLTTADTIIDDDIENYTFHYPHIEFAEFSGGLDSLYKFLSREMQYPKEAVKNGIQGRVFVQFVVEKDGSITDIRIVKGVDPILDEEAIRVIKIMPAWIPKEEKGEKVQDLLTLPITFTLNGD
jgi:TonB family protein